MTRSDWLRKALLSHIAGTCGTIAPLAFAQAKLAVEVDKRPHKGSSELWGIFFEDIDLSADGGIYPELVRNRSLEDGQQPEYWRLISLEEDKTSMSIDSSRPLDPFNRRSLRVKVGGSFALENGFILQVCSFGRCGTVDF